MPYRINVPEGEEALELILNRLGTPLLVDARKRMFRIMYDAPETSLSPREREVMRFPMTAMMGCPICNSMRMWRDWPGFSSEPIEEELYTNAEALNLDWPGFSARERLLLEFVDRFANAIDGMNGDDRFWERLHTNFSDTEIGDIIVMSGTWLGVGHGLKALGIGSVCALPASEETLRKLRNADLDVSTA
jgi:alkylhydroperoxidase family enzyme